MDLIFFDLDGTLLNKASEISPFTRDTLSLLNKNGIAYTVATGRTMLSAKGILDGHDFELPHIYNNGVTIWHPKAQQLSFENLLDNSEIAAILDVALGQGITPFVNAIDSEHHHFIFHPLPRHQVEKDLVEKYFSRTKAKIFGLEALTQNSQVTNISMIGDAKVITKMWQELNANPNLIAYSGPALEGENFRWMDVHHRLASKGSAVINLKQQLGASNIICFGDSDNDVSMFELADESYAPANAKPAIKALASQVIGDHHEDGIARFLRERFSL
ncbi:HAD family hydrolase [Glaciecola sp. SC05]|uniref:HAD family hydrolase n=1 Tax=Glaciecola sp. SC05 TaxID=1987355 RepID=UPI0035291A36